MRILNVKDLPKTVESTKTMLEFGKAIGEKPDLLNEIFTLPGYENLTLLRLTQNLAGLMRKKLGEADMRKIESFRFDWRIDAGPRIPETTISEASSTFNFEGSSSGVIITKEKMFSRGDVFELVDTGQQFRLDENARTLAHDKHANPCTLIGGRRDRSISSSVLTVGKRVRFIAGGIVPELSDYGSSMTMPNRMERHGNYITRFRVDGSSSGDYRYSEKIFLERLKRNPNGSTAGTGEFYTWSGQKQDMMDKLMFSINSGLLFLEGGFDDQLNHLIREIDGRPIPIGQGVIRQIRDYGQYMNYNYLSETLMRKIISMIVERRGKKTGNEIVIMVNWVLYQEVQRILDALTKNRLTPQDSYITREDGKKGLMVGATYCGYEWAGNRLILMEDSTLTDRYPDKGYGIVFNTRVDTKDGKNRMNLQQYTIEGFEMIENTILGVGGKSGHDSGIVSSAIHGSQDVLMAYRGIAVYDPYSTLIIEQN